MIEDDVRVALGPSTEAIIQLTVLVAVFAASTVGEVRTEGPA